MYGNFVNRALQLTKKYFNGVVPACDELLDIDKEVFNELKGVKEKVETLLNNYKFRDAQREVINIARIGNKYMTDCEPWKLWKTEPQRVETILYVCLQLVANLAIAFEPFLPFSSKKLRQLIHIENADWSKLGATDLLTQGYQLAEPELLFEDRRRNNCFPIRKARQH